MCILFYIGMNGNNVNMVTSPNNAANNMQATKQRAFAKTRTGQMVLYLVGAAVFILLTVGLAYYFMK